MFATTAVLLAAAHLALLTPCYAQASNNSSLQNCNSPINAIANGSQTFNSTGTVRLGPGPANKEPLYFSFGVIDDGNNATSPEREGFLSIPNSLAGVQGDKQTEYCMYVFPVQDASSQKEAGDCRGVLSDGCIDALQSIQFMSNGQCYPPNVDEACKLGEVGYLTSPSNFTNTTCTLTSLPDIDLPDNYTTFGPVLSMSSGLASDQGFEHYDRLVREAQPVVLSLKGPDGAGENKVICLAPNMVVEGSREPESAAARPSFGASLGVALVVMALVSVLL